MKACAFLALLLTTPAVAIFHVKGSVDQQEAACSAMDLKHRMQLQNKLAGVCEDMCKEVGAYPNCAQCPSFVAPDSTPGVMTWEELLEHMDNLVAWGQDMVKTWHKEAMALVQKDAGGDKSCTAMDMKHRMQVQNKLAGVCEDMCKEVGAYPKCSQCPAFVAPDSTPGVMTWDELLEHMDNLVAWGQGMIKNWHKEAAALVQKDAGGDKSCVTMDTKHRAQLQNKLAGVCEDMCKEVGAYPNCAQCPSFVAPDATPGVMTWEELLEHMDNLVAWGQGMIKTWHKEAAGLVQKDSHALHVKGSADQQEASCIAMDMTHRMQLQNKLAGVCEDMCKEVGAYPKCSQCPAFVAPDSTPGVMTWEELLEHMDRLSDWGEDMLKSWRKQAAALVQKGSESDKSCTAMDMKHRMQLQNKLAGVCEDMCREVGAYPKCSQCPAFVAPDSTPGVTTWEELLEHMDNLVAWGHSMLKGWRQQAAGLLQKESNGLAVKGSAYLQEAACSAEDLKHRMQLQNKLAGVCEDMCKEVGAYPKCSQCPAFVAPDSTPGVTTWEELLEHMDNLVAWGHSMLKSWHKEAAALPQVGSMMARKH